MEVSGQLHAPAALLPTVHKYNGQYTTMHSAVKAQSVWRLGYGLEDRGSTVRFPAGMGIFLFTTVSRTALRPTQPPIQWVQGDHSLGVKRPRREADHSPPSSARIKNAWNYTSTAQYFFMAWCLVKYRDNFTVTLP
jgi:hypothetical protein